MRYHTWAMIRCIWTIIIAGLLVGLTLLFAIDVMNRIKHEKQLIEVEIENCEKSFQINNC